MWSFFKRAKPSYTAPIGNDGVDHVASCLSLLTDREFASMSKHDVIELIKTMKLKG